MLTHSKTLSAQRVYLYIALPFYLIATLVLNTHTLRVYANSDIFDKTGIILSEYLTPEQKNRVRIICKDNVGGFRVLFYLDSPLASFQIIQEGEIFVPVPQDKEKIFIAIGDDVRIVSPAFRERSFGFFRMYAPVPVLSSQAKNT